MKTLARNVMVLVGAMLMGTFISCNDNEWEGTEGGLNEQNRISLSGEIDQVAVSRVNDSGFCDGDVMGVYIVDYQGTTPGTLQSSGNRGTNVRHTFDEAAYKWNSAYDVYWKDKNTHIDVYGYYPFGSPENVNAYEHTVAKDQSKEADASGMGGYEASDFLWGKAENVAPTSNVIRLPLKHIMSSAKIALIEGEGFGENEWNGLEKSVLVKGVKRKSSIDLSTGTVSAIGEVEATGTIPYEKSDYFRAIVVPQTISANVPLFSITVGGTAYMFKKEESFAYLSGKMHTFNIKVDKKAETGDFTFTLVGESITAWENDDVSHDATMKEYVVIESEAGKLKEAIVAAGKDYTKLQNLKVTGEIKDEDFYFMRDSMEFLSALNLKEVKIVAGSDGNTGWHGDLNKEDMIPLNAFSSSTAGGKKSLTRIILPDRLTTIGSCAFRGCGNLTGSLIIPEGVVEIQQGAFTDCVSFDGTLSLPTTLKYIGTTGSDNVSDMQDNDYFLGTFYGCRFVCELIIPNSVEVIRGHAFANCNGLHGELRLPDGLMKLGANAFGGCGNLTGSLTIPQNITMIPDGCFEGCKFNGNLQLHDGITSIGSRAFLGNPFKGELVLPKNLTVLSDNVFNGCDFYGELKLPKGLRTIGANAFGSWLYGSNWRLMGILEIPESVVSIGEEAFYNCWGLEGIIFPEGLESIRNGAFYQCYGIGSIVSKSGIPPYIMGNAFDGVAKDNFTLEVPESAITLYQTEPGWMDFKRIAAHRELVCRPSIANAINTECTRRLVLNAEGDWEVESMPDWCSLSQTSGSKKTELTLTIHEMAQGSAPRTGEIVFKLKDKDYTHKCTVSQYDYQYAEDEIITLQQATKGNRGGINLVFLGDGYDAKDISEGKYLEAMYEQVENFFGIEPYKTYRDYFNVYTSIAVSPESGIGGVNTIIHNRFNTTAKGGVSLGGRYGESDFNAIFKYVCDRVPGVSNANLDQTLIVMIPNTKDYGGICYMWDGGAAIAYCPMSDYGYPTDFRGVIQHEAGGHGFAKLGDEYIYHNAFIDNCQCTCCGHVFEFNMAKGLGWYENLSLTGKMNEVPWSHLIFHEKYSQVVDIFEGGYMHTRGVFRSEQNSCMNNMIPYYSTISREVMVKRIKAIAGEPYDFEDFVANDILTAGGVEQTAMKSSLPEYLARPAVQGHEPVFMGKRQTIN